MSKMLFNSANISAIAAKIRAKLGVATVYKPSEMAAAIESIPTPNLDTLSVIQNGTYTPASPKNGFSSVAVNVPNSYAAGDEGKVVSNGELVAQGSDSVTQNGTVDTTLISSLTVNVSGGGGNAYAFLHALYTEGKVVTVTDGTTTFTGDDSGDYWFELPNGGVWTAADNIQTASVDISKYDSKTINLRLFKIVQNNTGDSNASFIYSNGGRTLTVTWTCKNSNSGWGFTFTTSGKNIRVTVSGTGDKQWGDCTSGATLPKIISEGANRGNYYDSNGSVSYRSSYPKWFAGIFNGSAGQTVTYTITITN